MIDAILYNSNTGFTKQYAYRFAVQTKLPIYSLKEIKKIAKGSHIIFFSWVLGSNITKLSALKDYKIEMICAVGMRMYSEDLIEELKQKNNLEHLFYLQGGLRLYKLNMLHRFMIKMVRNSLKRKKRNSQISLEEERLLVILTSGSETIDLNALDSLIEIITHLENSYIN